MCDVDAGVDVCVLLFEGGSYSPRGRVVFNLRRNVFAAACVCVFWGVYVLELTLCSRDCICVCASVCVCGLI